MKQVCIFALLCTASTVACSASAPASDESSASPPATDSSPAMVGIPEGSAATAESNEADGAGVPGLSQAPTPSEAQPAGGALPEAIESSENGNSTASMVPEADMLTVEVEPDELLLVEPPAEPMEENSCGVQEFDRERKPSEVLLVLDRSGSMRMEFRGAGNAASKWAATVPSVVGTVESAGNSIWWGYQTFPAEGTRKCADIGTYPPVPSPVAENNALAVVEQIQLTEPEGDGTPTGDAVKFAAAHLASREAVSQNPKYILLVTDGEPVCGGDGMESTDYAVSEIGAALDAGYPTFVLGVDTSKEKTVAKLNRMAEAGGQARMAGGGPSFYLASTPEEIQVALEAITGQIGSCVFDLDPPPPVPENIAVDFSGVRTDRDPTRMNGWEYTTDDHTQLEVHGSWCDRIKTEAKNVVNIKYGCPNIPIKPPQ